MRQLLRWIVIEVKGIKSLSPSFEEDINMDLVILVGYEKGGLMVMMRKVMAE